MLAAEQGAGDNTLDAYRRDLTDFSEFLGRSRPKFCRCRDPDAARLPRRPRHARLQIVQRGAPAVGDAASVPLPAQRADPQRRSRGDPVRPETRPRPAQGAVDRGRRPHADAGQGADAKPDASPQQRLRALRLHCLLEVLYATGLRVSELVALPLSAARRDARMIVVRGKGNKERLVPLNEASRQAMADYLAAMEALKPEKKKNAARLEMAVSLLRRKRASDATAFCARPEGARVRLGAGAAAGLAARAAPRLRQPPPAQRRRPAHRANAARPHRYFDHADLYPCGRGAAQEPGARPASAGGEVDFRVSSKYAALTSAPSPPKQPSPLSLPAMGHPPRTSR